MSYFSRHGGHYMNNTIQEWDALEALMSIKTAQDLNDKYERKYQMRNVLKSVASNNRTLIRNMNVPITYKYNNVNNIIGGNEIRDGNIKMF